MTLNIKKAGLEMVERANSSEKQVFGSFYLSRLLGLNTVSYTHLTLPTNREV